MRFSAKRLRPMYDNLEEAYGRYSSGQIDAIRGIEIGEGAGGRGGVAPADARPVPGARRPRLPHAVPRAGLPGLAPAGHVRVVRRSSCSSARSRSCTGSSRSAQFVAFNALIALANGAGARRCSRSGTSSSYARVLLGRLDDVLEQEPEQGARPLAAAAGDDARGPRRAARTSASATAGPEAPAILEELTLHGRAGRDGRDRRPQRLRQDDADQAARRAARADRGHDPLRRRRPAHARLPDAAPADRLRAPGELSLRRHDRGQHRVRRGRASTRARLAGPRRRRTRTSSSSGCRSATRRGSASPACGSPAASSSGSRSRARSITGRRSCSSTRRRARSTPSPSGRSRRASTSCSSAARRS